MSSRAIKLGVAFLVVVAVLATYLFIHRGEESTDDATIEAHVL